MSLKQIYSTILLPGREEEAKVLMLALIAKEHAVLIGPPGTAKSLLISTLAKLFDVPYFEYLLTKFTLPEELFGVPNIKLLREQGEYQLITRGKLPEAKLAFLDEIFKGSSAILNTLLSILNERKFFDGQRMVKVPLWTCLGASNEVPSEPELQALYDRFLFRQFVGYVKPELWEQLLQTYWIIHQPNYVNNLPKFDFSVIEKAHEAIWSVDVFTVKKQLLEILAKLRDQKIEVSDRRKGRCLIALAAAAVFEGRSAVVPEDLLVLKYTIPERAEDVPIVEQVIVEVAGKHIKARQQLAELVPQLEDLIKKLDAAQSFAEALKLAEALKPLHGKFSDLRNLVPDAPEVQRIQELLDEFSRKLVEKVKV